MRLRKRERDSAREIVIWRFSTRVAIAPLYDKAGEGNFSLAWLLPRLGICRLFLNSGAVCTEAFRTNHRCANNTETFCHSLVTG